MFFQKAKNEKVFLGKITQLDDVIEHNPIVPGVTPYRLLINFSRACAELGERQKQPLRSEEGLALTHGILQKIIRLYPTGAAIPWAYYDSIVSVQPTDKKINARGPHLANAWRETDPMKFDTINIQWKNKIRDRNHENASSRAVLSETKQVYTGALSGAQKSHPMAYVFTHSGDKRELGVVIEGTDFDNKPYQLLANGTGTILFQIKKNFREQDIELFTEFVSDAQKILMPEEDAILPVSEMLDHPIKFLSLKPGVVVR